MENGSERMGKGRQIERVYTELKENFWQSVLILIVWDIILGVVGARVVKKRECA